MVRNNGVHSEYIYIKRLDLREKETQKLIFTRAVVALVTLWMVVDIALFFSFSDIYEKHRHQYEVWRAKDEKLGGRGGYLPGCFMNIRAWPLSEKVDISYSYKSTGYPC